MLKFPYQLFYYSSKSNLRCSRFYTGIPSEDWIGVPAILINREKNTIARWYGNHHLVLDDWQAKKEFLLQPSYFEAKTEKYIAMDEFRLLVAAALTEEQPK